MNNYKVTIEYDGTCYHGFAKQPGLATIQGVLEETLEKILKEKIEVYGAGRTDAKVHAMGQVINFFTNSNIEAMSLVKALNSNLPRDIVAINSEIVSKDFNARFSAKSKTYMYRINYNINPSALNKDREYYCKYKINIENIKLAAKSFIGKYDFVSFRNVGTPINDTVREIYDVYFDQSENGILKIYFKGNGFLYNQVRIMVGTLIEIGRGIKNVDDIEKILQKKERSLAGATAEPQGLYLINVEF